jgi:hypothetical protein
VPSPLPGGQRRRLDRACVQSGEDPISFKKQLDALLSSLKFKETKEYKRPQYSRLLRKWRRQRGLFTASSFPPVVENTRFSGCQDFQEDS